MKKFFTLFLLSILLVSKNSLANNDSQYMKSKIKIAISDYISQRFLNASFAFATDDEILSMGVKGASSLDEARQLKVNEKLFIGTATQTFTAAAILRLYDRKLLSLNDKISKFFGENSNIWYDNQMPSWANEISIHHLLTHSSGLKEYLNNIKINQAMLFDDIKKDIINFTLSSQLLFQPGTKHNYVSTNYVILGMIIESVTNKSLSNFFEQEFFKPLNMQSTYLPSWVDAIKIQDDSSKYSYTKYYKVIANNTSKPEIVKLNFDNLFISYADMGIVSNVHDMITWYKALNNGMVLSKSSYDVMLKSHIKLQDKNVGYGVYISKISKDKHMIHNYNSHISISETGYIKEIPIYFAVLSNILINQNNDSIDNKRIENQIDLKYFRDSVLDSILY